MADRSWIGSIHYHRVDFLISDADYYPLYACSFASERGTSQAKHQHNLGAYWHAGYGLHIWDFTVPLLTSYMKVRLSLPLSYLNQATQLTHS
jgi:hypothetical protein